jgi:MFS transporter, ACS family, glucarate transporter
LDTAKPTHKRFIVMVFLGTLAFITYFDRVCITRAEPDIKADLQISDKQMGLIMGAFWLAYALFELPTGWMGDRYGARGTLTRVVLAWSVFTSLSGSATGFYSLFLWRFLFGAGEAGAFPNMARVQSRWLPISSRTTASGLLWLLARWGGAFSPLIFGAMMEMLGSRGFRSMLAATPGLSHFEHTAAWRLGFWLSGIIGLFWVVTFWLWFRDHPAEKASVNKAELELITRGAPPETRGHGMPAGGWAALFSCRSLWAMGAYYLCGSFAWSFFVSWMPKYFNDVMHVKYARSGFMVAMPMFLAGFSCLIGGALSNWLVQRTGRKRLFRAIFPLFGASTAGLAIYAVKFAQTPTQATILLCIAAAAFDFGQAANWATIVDLGGKYAGSAAGLVNMIGNLGNAFQPVIGAMIFGAVGWNALFAVYAVAYVVAASMWFFIDPTKTFYNENATADAAPV